MCQARQGWSSTSRRLGFRLGIGRLDEGGQRNEWFVLVGHVVVYGVVKGGHERGVPRLWLSMSHIEYKDVRDKSQVQR